MNCDAEIRHTHNCASWIVNIIYWVSAVEKHHPFPSGSPEEFEGHMRIPHPTVSPKAFILQLNPALYPLWPHR